MNKNARLASATDYELRCLVKLSRAILFQNTGFVQDFRISRILQKSIGLTVGGEPITTAYFLTSRRMAPLMD